MKKTWNYVRKHLYDATNINNPSEWLWYKDSFGVFFPLELIKT